MMTLTYIAAAVVLLGLCIFVHELGHLLGGKMVGIKAEVFSLGYGRGFIKKKFGDTTYQVTLIPFGGYCKFYGENPSGERTGNDFEFLSAAPWKRIVTVAMGPLFNLFFGIILFFIMNLYGYPVETNKILIPAEITKGKNISAAYKAGLRSNDRIIEINGKRITSFSDIQAGVIFSEIPQLSVKVKRNNSEQKFDVVPNISADGSRRSIGVIPYGKRVLVAGLLPGDVAEKSGLMKMDEISSIDGKKINSPQQFTGYIQKNPGKSVNFEILRTGKKLELNLTPRVNEILSVNGTPVLDTKMMEKALNDKKLSFNSRPAENMKQFISRIEQNLGKTVIIESNDKIYRGRAEIIRKGFIGIYPAIAPEMIVAQFGVADAFVRSLVEPYDFIVMNLKGMAMLFSGKMNVRENLSGPIRIAQIAGDVAYYRGISAFIILMAKISIILMVMNFLPIPVVDGGHLVFFTIEAIRGKPLSDELMGRIQSFGVILLLMLAAFVIINDLSMLPFIQKLIN